MCIIRCKRVDLELEEHYFDIIQPLSQDLISITFLSILDLFGHKSGKFQVNIALI